MIVSVAIFATEPLLAVMVAVVDDLTVVVFAVNVPAFLPDRMVTELGKVATFELLDNVITTPALGARPLIVTVPVEKFPPTIVDGLKLSAVNKGASTVIVAVFVTGPSMAEMVAVTSAATGKVLTVKAADVAPDGTVTKVGAFAAVELLER